MLRSAVSGLASHTLALLPLVKRQVFCVIKVLHSYCSEVDDLLDELYKKMCKE